MLWLRLGSPVSASDIDWIRDGQICLEIDGHRFIDMHDVQDFLQIGDAKCIQLFGELPFLAFRRDIRDTSFATCLQFALKHFRNDLRLSCFFSRPCADRLRIAMTEQMTPEEIKEALVQDLSLWSPACRGAIARKLGPDCDLFPELNFKSPMTEEQRQRVYFKFLTKDHTSFFGKTDHRYQYRLGVNSIPEDQKFHSVDECTEGRLYFCTVENLPNFSNHNLGCIAILRVPSDAETVQLVCKFGADKVEVLKFIDDIDDPEFRKLPDVCSLGEYDLCDRLGIYAYVRLRKRVNSPQACEIISHLCSRSFPHQQQVSETMLRSDVICEDVLMIIEQTTTDDQMFQSWIASRKFPLSLSLGVQQRILKRISLKQAQLSFPNTKWKL